jgi:hypothetical protein
MSSELKIGDKSFFVDDPNGKLGHPAHNKRKEKNSFTDRAFEKGKPCSWAESATQGGRFHQAIS